MWAVTLVRVRSPVRIMTSPEPTSIRTAVIPAASSSRCSSTDHGADHGDAHDHGDQPVKITTARPIITSPATARPRRIALALLPLVDPAPMLGSGAFPRIRFSPDPTPRIDPENRPREPLPVDR
jgi:hypothetical protein